ncbi:MAG: SNF2 helicase-associated domain-containing protein, partial [Mycobacteriaceae bacterium]
MVVVHGLWSAGTGLLLWFETPQTVGRIARAGGVHPHAVGDPATLPAPPVAWAARLQDALRPTALRRRPEVLVPTRGGLPVSEGPDGLTPFHVPALALAPPDAADLLHEIAHAHTLTAHGWALSPELVFLGDVAAGVARWVYSGRVVPSLRALDDEHWARWVLVDDGPVRAWRARIGAALPPALRGEVVDGVARTPDQVVDDLLDELTDAVVRGTLRLSQAQARGTFHPLIRSLEGAEPLEAFGASTYRLRTGLSEWASSSSLDAPEVLFRLLEPADDDPVAEPRPDAPPGDTAREPTWILETCLRTEDSAPVPVRTLPRSPETAGLALTALGRAMTAWPRLRSITPDVREHVVALRTADAVDLVTRGAARLAEAGITVLLPRAWTRLDPTMSLQLSTPPASAAVTSGSVGMDSLVDYRWQLALGDVVLTAAELAELAGAKAELVRLRGEWVRVEGAALARAARYVASHSAEQVGLGAVLGALTGADVPPLPVEDVQATGWLGDLLAAGDAHLEPVPAPPGLRAVLRPYQQRGLEWLAFMSRLGLGVV